MSRLGAAALLVSLTLSFPAAALAQTVGDDQYRDPFAGQDEQQDQGAQNDAGQDQTTAPSPAPAPAPTTPAPTDPSTGEPIATVADTLPRTGTAAGWVAAAGLILLAAGIGLRRTAPA